MNYIEPDCLAILRDGNTVSFVPVYLDADDIPFVKINNAWRPVSELENFERYEKRSKRKLYDTARNRMVEV